jgi:hypothetical protein
VEISKIIRVILQFSKKTPPKVNSHPIGENSSNLVTLVAIDIQRFKNPAFQTGSKSQLKYCQIFLFLCALIIF